MKNDSAVLEKHCHALCLQDTDEMCSAPTGTRQFLSWTSGARKDSSTHHRDQDRPPKTTANNDSFAYNGKDTMEMFWLLMLSLAIQVPQCELGRKWLSGSSLDFS